jgi:hypothetical protein
MSEISLGAPVANVAARTVLSIPIAYQNYRLGADGMYELTKSSVKSAGELS